MGLPFLRVNLFITKPEEGELGVGLDLALVPVLEVKDTLPQKRDQKIKMGAAI